MRLLRFGLLFAAAIAVSPSGCAQSITPSETGGQGGQEPATGGSADAGPDGSCTGAQDCAAFGDACNTGACVNGTCGKLAANENGACDDGKTCTQNDACQSGVCVGGDLKPCPAIDGCHL